MRNVGANKEKAMRKVSLLALVLIALLATVGTVLAINRNL